MKPFELDKRLAADCSVLGKLDDSHLLLLNNALVPWFILVPETTEIEMIDLPDEQLSRVNSQIERVSQFVRANFNIEKLNTAAIGNVVNQLHIHIIGRHSKDFCWPDVVWGRSEKEPYTEQTIIDIKALVAKKLL